MDQDPRTNQKIPITSTKQLIFWIYTQLRQQPIYGHLFNISDITKKIAELKLRYISDETAASFINLLLEMLSIAKEEHRTDIRSHKENLYALIKKIEENINFVLAENRQLNQEYLKMVLTLTKGDQSQRNPWGSYKFDFSELHQVAAITKDFCKIDIHAFAVLTNYLLQSCINLAEDGLNIEAINIKLESVLNELSIAYPPTSSVFQIQSKDAKVLRYINNIQNMKDYQNIYQSVNLTHVSKDQRKTAIMLLIKKKAKESMKNYNKFVDLVKDICAKEGYHFKADIKLKDASQTKAMHRIMEKLLNSNFKEHFKQQSPIFDKRLTIEEAAKKQQNNYQRTITNLLQREGPLLLQFTVTDMLRAKCLFASIQKIKGCYEQIKQKIKSKQTEGFRLLEVDNRLLKENSDLVLKILVGGTIAELQLGSELNIITNQFSHKIFEIRRSKYFSLITMLFRMNESLSNQFFGKMRDVITANTWMKQRNCYNSEVTFQDVKSKFSQFLLALPVKIRNYSQEDPLDALKLQAKVDKFRKIVRPEFMIIQSKGKQIRKYKYMKEEQMHERFGLSQQNRQNKFGQSQPVRDANLQAKVDVILLKSMLDDKQYKCIYQSKKIDDYQLSLESSQTKSSRKDKKTEELYILQLSEKIHGFAIETDELKLINITKKIQMNYKYIQIKKISEKIKIQSLLHLKQKQISKNRESSIQKSTIYDLLLGNAYLVKKNIKQSLICFQNLLQNLQKVHTIYSSIVCYDKIGDCYFQLRQYHQAIANYEKYLKKINVNGPKENRDPDIFILNKIIRCLQELKDKKKEIQSIEKLLDLNFQGFSIFQYDDFCEIFQRKHKIIVLLILGREQIIQKNGKQVQKCAEQALRECQTFMTENSLLLAYYLNGIGSLFIRSHNIRKGYELCLKSWKILRQRQIPFDCQHKCLSQFVREGKVAQNVIVKVNLCLLKLSQLACSHDSLSTLPILYHIADIHVLMGHYSEADDDYRLFLSSKKAHAQEASHLDEKEWHALLSLSKINFELGKYKTANKYINLALSTYQSQSAGQVCLLKEMQMYSLKQQIDEKRKNYQDQVKSLKKCMEIAVAYNGEQIETQCVFMARIAKAYWNFDKGQAEQWFQRSLSLAKTVFGANSQQYVKILFFIGNQLWRCKQYEQAYPFLREGIEVSEKNSIKFLEQGYFKQIMKKMEEILIISSQKIFEAIKEDSLFRKITII